MTVIHGVYNCLKDGLFGRFFTAYSAEDGLFRAGVLGKLFSKRNKAAILLRRIRLLLSEFFEKSLIIEKMTKASSYLLGCSLRFYGIATLTFGAYSVLVFYIKQYVFPDQKQDNASLIVSVILLVFGLLMMGSKQSVAQLIQRGLIPHYLLIGVLGIPEERLDVPHVKGGGRYNISLIAGMLCGILTILIPSQIIVLGILCLVLVAIVMSYPEIGVFALIALFPFLGWEKLPLELLDFAILITGVAYLGKLIRGKRIFRFSLIDAMMLLLAVLIWFSGTVSLGGDASAEKAQHVCMLLLVYFMVVNLIRTPAWLHRVTLAMVGAAVILAFGGICQYMVRAFYAASPEMLPWLSDGVSLIFDAPNVFGSFIMTILPFCLAIVTNTLNSKSRLVALWGCAVMLIAAALTWSRSAWLGILVSVLVYFLIYSRKTACWLLLGGITVPIWFEFLPQPFVKYCLGMLNTADAAIYRQIYTWRGSVRMIVNHLLGGIGYGTEAFQEVYPKYSYIGLETSESTGSLFLTLFTVVGLFGVLVFAASLVIFAQHSLEYIRNASGNYSRSFVAAGLASLIGALVTGIGSDIWHHETVFLSSVIVWAITCAYIRVGSLIRARNQDVSNVDVSHAHVDLYFEV